MGITLALGMVVKSPVEANRLLSDIEDSFDEILIVLDNPQEDHLPASNDSPAPDRLKFIESKNLGYDQARNLYLSNCTSDWLITLDADETISNDRIQAIRWELKSVPQNIAVLRLPILNYFGYGRWVTTFNPRVIRILPGMKYDEYIHHPSLTTSVKLLGMSFGRSPQFIEHFGPLLSGTDFTKRKQRASALETQMKKVRLNSATYCMLGLEYIALGDIARGLEYLTLALNVDEGNDEDKDTARFFRALLYYRLNLAWLARQELERVSLQKSFCGEAQMLLADLDAREGKVISGLERLKPFVALHPNSIHLLVNAATLAAVFEPFKAVEWAKRSLELLPTLWDYKIYGAGAAYNIYAFQDIFLSTYTDVFSVLSLAYTRLGDSGAAKYWLEQRRNIFKNQS